MILSVAGGSGNLLLEGSAKGKGFVIGEIDSSIEMEGNLVDERKDVNTPFGPTKNLVDNSGDLTVTIKRSDNGLDKEYKLVLKHQVF